MLVAGSANAAPAAESLRVTVTGLRSARGQVLACMTARPDAFPDCGKDRAARKLAVPATGTTMTLDFGPVAPGTYAISLFHDENSNGRLDRTMLVPREGFGFSRDAPVRLGPPRFAAAAFAFPGAAAHESIRVRYAF